MPLLNFCKRHIKIEFTHQMVSVNPKVGWWQISEKQQHETYEARTQLLPELPIIGRLHLLQAVPGGLRSDAHPKEYELHLVQEGCLELWVDSPAKTAYRYRRLGDFDSAGPDAWGRA